MPDTSSTPVQSTARPRAKHHLRRREGGQLEVLAEGSRLVRSPDPDGVLDQLLALADGTHRTDELAGLLADRDLSPDRLSSALAVLDQLRLVEDAAHGDQLCSGQRERYSSNLAFFGAFASLQRSRFDLQSTLLDSSVLLLGLGGVGSSVLTSLAGLGVGRVTAVDYDTVELRNLSRQLLYSESDLGRPKLTVATERARQLNPHMEFVPVSRRLTGPEDVADLLPGHQLVLALVDQPPAVKQWVNDACVAAGVPYVAGGIQGCAVAYYSVAPRLSGCLACLLHITPDRLAALTAPLADWPNTAVAPAAAMAGGLIGMEALRYLTGIAEPVSCGRLWRMDLVTGGLAPAMEWRRRPDCPTCGSPEPVPSSPGGR